MVLTFTPENITKLGWVPWIRRDFAVLTLSFFEKAGTPPYSNKAGFGNALLLPAQLFQNGMYFESKTVLDAGYESLIPFFKKHDMFDVTKNLETYHKKAKKEILALVKKKQDPFEKLYAFQEIMTVATTFIWATHMIEHWYGQCINDEVPKHFKGNVDEFVGNVSFPKKKNEYMKMDDLIRKGVPAEKIIRKYGWIKIRNTYSEPFTVHEIEQMRSNIKPVEKHKRVPVPKPLKRLVSEIQELVFFRTARTDVFYDLLFTGRPILLAAAQKMGVTLREFNDYTIESIRAGKPRKFLIDQFSSYSVAGKTHYQVEPLIQISQNTDVTQVKGMTAFVGVITGTAKIVHRVSELDKVKDGDVLVTQMTFPSFIVAMKRACAFVTDEGGITCHAAIVAREMKKPCVIGTKLATKVFKDGNRIEVDATKGIVRKL